MNSDSPHSSREELEARLTALLLGELSVAEAATMRRAIEQDAELAQLYERLERTINLVHEAAASPIEHAAASSTVLKLSEGNRQRLLQSFKTAARGSAGDDGTVSGTAFRLFSGTRSSIVRSGRSGLRPVRA
jgi:anti-sigma factor RsiW